MKMLRPLLATFIGFLLGLLITVLAGENPLNVLMIFLKSSFGSTYDFGMTLVYAAPLIFTGLSVAIAFQAGLFNIGAEGQLTMGALAAAAVGILVPASFFWAPLFAAVCAAVAGGCWGGIAGYLKAKRGSHEVITTIMLNFIAAGIASYITVYLLKDPNVQNPQTLPIAPQYVLQQFAIFQGAPVSSAFLLAIASSFLVWLFLYRTPWGYEMRVVGENPNAAGTANIGIAKTQVMTMFWAGSLAGLVGVVEVLGKLNCFRLDLSPGYGFTGIAVAFLAKGNPLAILASAFLFGALQKSSSDLEIYTHSVTSDLALVIQAFIILAVAADGIWEKIALNRRKKLLVEKA